MSSKINFGSMETPKAETPKKESKTYKVASKRANHKSNMIANFQSDVFKSGKEAVKVQLEEILGVLANKSPLEWSNFVKWVFFSAFQAGNGSSLHPRIMGQNLDEVDATVYSRENLKQASPEEKNDLTRLKIDHNAYIAHKHVSKVLSEIEIWAYSTLIEVIPSEVWSAMFAQFATFAESQKSYIRNQTCFWILLPNKDYTATCKANRYLPPWPACAKSREYYLETDIGKKQKLLVNRLIMTHEILTDSFPETPVPNNSWGTRCFTGLVRTMGRSYSSEKDRQKAFEKMVDLCFDKYNKGAEAGVDGRVNFIDYDKLGSIQKKGSVAGLNL